MLSCFGGHSLFIRCCFTDHLMLVYQSWCYVWIHSSHFHIPVAATQAHKEISPAPCLCLHMIFVDFNPPCRLSQEGIWIQSNSDWFLPTTGKTNKSFLLPKSKQIFNQVKLKLIIYTWKKNLLLYFDHTRGLHCPLTFSKVLPQLSSHFFFCFFFIFLLWQRAAYIWWLESNYSPYFV